MVGGLCDTISLNKFDCLDLVQCYNDIREDDSLSQFQIECALMLHITTLPMPQTHKVK